MNQIKLNELIKEEKIVTPLYILRMIREFNLTSNEVLMLIYLYDKDKEVFNPTKICEDLNMDLMQMMETISNLSDKNLLIVNTVKDDKGIMQEIIDLSLFYDKVTNKVIELLNTKEDNNENLHEIIENEFGRRLSPMEHEMIDDWERVNSKELIKEAVKEASINGVSNLRYIDKILFDWNKSGIKKPSEIKKEKQEEIKEEIYNCDWLNDDDEEI